MAGDSDVVVSKFNPTLSQLLASTFVGGAQWEGATAMAIEIDTAAWDPRRRDDLDGR